MGWPIQSLWIGDRLSALERLSIRSFLANGHGFDLYTYQRFEGCLELFQNDGVEFRLTLPYRQQRGKSNSCLDWNCTSICVEVDIPLTQLTPIHRFVVWKTTRVRCRNSSARPQFAFASSDPQPLQEGDDHLTVYVSYPIALAVATGRFSSPNKGFKVHRKDLLGSRRA